jgi:hypothetical protein
VIRAASACLGRVCKGIDLGPQATWAQISTALADDSDLRYLSDISYLPSPGRCPHGGVSTPLVVGLAVLAVALMSTLLPGARRTWKRSRPRR